MLYLALSRLEVDENSSNSFKELYFKSLIENPLDISHLEIMQNIQKFADLAMEENQNKMIEETTHFLLELNNEYQNEIEIAKSRFREFDDIKEISNLS